MAERSNVRCLTVELPMARYEQLSTNEAMFEAVSNYIKNSDFPTIDTIKAIIDMKEEVKHD